MRSPTGHRLVVSDNFYTRHTFAHALLKYTDGEMHLLGTVRLNLVSKPAVKASIERVDASERGSWELVGEVRLEPGWMEKQKKHQTNQRRLPKAQRTTYDPVIVQPRRLDTSFTRTKVIFYTNEHLLNLLSLLRLLRLCCAAMELTQFNGGLKTA
ncbi:hypothetical protein PPTG_21508 [Phytophthora nicotianae INRA-310]|uniref:PiggyBac transposable element-derived protein domain-containing protein n=1 Tax=Phytophthora nicotianae (strain INRA-310) TaxID=761204 RepID=W2R0N4_PHYN3|nr:hypothetical protein PPTG_21508 [Phytophthora nicotianae INRA-310]ETN18075.1 hypothetical protein PPTG_21508 [Phytophthora nicotianae INRA-310]